MPAPVDRSAVSLTELWISLAIGVTAPIILALWTPPFWASFLEWGARNIKAVMAHQDWAGLRLILTGFVIIFLWVVAIALHECGHLIAGLAVGFRFRSIRVGPIQIDKPFRISRYRDPASADRTHGWVKLDPVGDQNLRLRAAMMILAGPAANIGSGYVLVLLQMHHSLILGAFVGFSMFMGFGNLIPFRFGRHVPDGLRLLKLLFDRQGSERWLAVLKMSGAVQDGVPVKSLSSTDVQRATSVRDKSAETVFAHFAAFIAAFYERNNAKAADALETCLKYSAYTLPSMRILLICNAAVFQANRAKRADLAAQWVADLPESMRPLLATKVDAAFLEANGDTAGLVKKLEEHEAEILKLPTESLRTAWLKSLAEWRSDLKP